MRIFVTGASGFIGSAVAQALARAGHRVRGLVRDEVKARALAAREIEPVLGTMEDPRSLLARSADCEVLVHCAAEYSARGMELEQRTIAALLGEAGTARASRLFLYTSGVWVYGDTGSDAVDESSPLRPAPLSAARVGHEQQVLEADRGVLRTLVIRPGCVFGGAGSLTGEWFSSATQDGAARIVGDGANRWAMVHLQDLADLYLRAAESGLRAEVINAVDGSRFSVLECARAASLAAGAGGKVQSLTQEEGRARYGPMSQCLAFDQHVDSGKAQRLLGWRPRHQGFVDGAVRYHRAWQAARAGAVP